MTQPTPAKRIYQPWTTQEMAYVRAHYAKDGARAVAAALGRKWRNVAAFAKRNGISGHAGISTLDCIRQRCDIDPTDDDACWVWRGALSHGTPSARPAGMSASEAVHRVAWRLAGNPKPTKGLHIVRTCGCKLCCNPKHLRMQRRDLIMQQARAAAPGYYADRVREGKLARGLTKLDWQAVAHIRASNETNKALAARFGVGERHVLSVRRGDSWIRAADPLGLRGMAGT